MATRMIQDDPSYQNGHFGQEIKAVIYLLTTNLDCQLLRAFHACWLSSMTILEQMYCFMFIKYAPKKGQIAPCLDGRQYVLPITHSHNMSTDNSAYVLHRTIGGFVFVTKVVSVCIPVCSSYAHSMIIVDREWYVWINCFLYIPNATKEATTGMAKITCISTYKTPNYTEYK